MKIEDTQFLKEVRQFIEGYFETFPSLELFVADELGKSLNHFVSENTTFPITTLYLVRELNNQGNLLTCLEKLYIVVEKAGTLGPEVEALLDRARDLVSAAAGGTGNAFENCFVGRYPYANQQQLRNALKTLAGTNQGLLVVSGPALSGKTYSKYLIAHIARSVGAGDPIIADMTEVEDAAVPEHSVPKWFDLAAMSFTRGGSSAQDQLDQYAQKPRNGDLLGNWFFLEANNRDDTTWVIIDNVSTAIDNGSADDTSQAIVKRIAKSAFDNVSGKAKFILMCSSTDWLPSEIRNWNEPVELSFFSVKDLTTYFGDFATEYELSSEYDDDQLTAAATQLIENYGPTSNEPDLFAKYLKEFLFHAYPEAREKVGA